MHSCNQNKIIITSEMDTWNRYRNLRRITEIEEAIS